ncbi:MAG: hypothetical protein EVJ46_00230 [Candidatus Acididesulfobacter guangdongensis]|uniref:HNH domain-containing protein n=1 Tax=Acididesulfobacter guangdongensis TaxID=2597225 RepID=A0A519BHG8_ACIG2|nr:MAG: hypothetical protein EVJ46_00230 [Candidatus Acididesulfobacter guangdongensis]
MKTMKIDSIKSHLRPYSITNKRKTTINHAFASAIAPNDSYDINKLKEAVRLLGQNEDDLHCVYCGKPAETWDHLVGLVKNSEYSGYGHVIGNLVPCCKDCNSKKGNKNWRDFLKDKDEGDKKENIIKEYIKKYYPKKVSREEIEKACSEEMYALDSLKENIIKLFKQADEIAESIRLKIKDMNKSI